MNKLKHAIFIGLDIFNDIYFLINLLLSAYLLCFDYLLYSTVYLEYVCYTCYIVILWIGIFLNFVEFRTFSGVNKKIIYLRSFLPCGLVLIKYALGVWLAC